MKRAIAIRRRPSIDRRLWLYPQTEHHPLLNHMLVERVVGLVQPHWNVQHLLRARHPGHVVEVRVRQQDVADAKLVDTHVVEECLDLVAGIHDDPLPRRFAAEYVPIFVEWLYGTDFNDHERG